MWDGEQKNCPLRYMNDHRWFEIIKLYLFVILLQTVSSVDSKLKKEM